MIGLMDCNNFFVSCERLFRPDLAKRPVAVLSSNDGCVVSRSQEVKDMGVPMGVPYFKVNEVCDPKLITFFSSNFTLYRDISSRVMQVLLEETAQVEIYSIDEAFFNIDELARAREIRTLVMKKVGIPVSIGVAPTKTLAKYASALAKKGSGVHLLSMDDWDKKVGAVPVHDIWGVGRKTAEKLNTFNIRTVKDILDQDMSFMKNNFGVEGDRLRLELSGVAAHTLTNTANVLHKSIMSSRSFEKTTSDRGVLESAVAYHVTEAASKLRADDCLASRMYVSIRTARHGDFSLRGGGIEVVLEEPTANTQTLLREAVAAVRRIYEPHVPYKKAGIVLSGLMPTSFKTTSLFSERKGEDDNEIDVLTDALNLRFGHGTVRSGLLLREERFAAKHTLRSKQYTTKWSDIASVKAV